MPPDGRDLPVGGEPGEPGEEGVARDPHIYGTADQARRKGAHGRVRHRWRSVVLVGLGLVVVVVVAGTLWVRAEASPSGPPGAQVIVAVRSGSGVDQLASTLQSRGVIGSGLAYRIWGQFHGVPGILPGEYAFNKNSSFGAVDTVISTGPNVFTMEIPPGFTVSEVAERVGQFPGYDATAFDSLATSGTVRSPWQPAGSTNLDGLLGTGAYTLLPGETDTKLLTEMISRFDTEADQVGLTAGAAKLGFTPYQVITIASIVEKEAVLTKNMGPVARVIYNRLAAGMPLQMDSTVLYAEGRDGGTVTSQDLKVQSPYNTYLNKGLTPSPTCFPSRQALEATLDPPTGSWLYFVVVRSDGTEAFADTFAEQQANEALAAQRGVS
jgi:UPF0755 protein